MAQYNDEHENEYDLRHKDGRRAKLVKATRTRLEEMRDHPARCLSRGVSAGELAGMAEAILMAEQIASPVPIAQPEIRDDGKTNPLIIIDKDQLIAALRRIADEAGYSDRGISAVQLGWIDDGERRTVIAVPEIVVMVSNIPNSRSA